MASSTQYRVELGRLEAALRSNATDKGWTRAQVSSLAPRYGGKVEKFSLSKHISMFKQRHAPLESKPATASIVQSLRFQEPKGTLQEAIMRIFHVACPNPIRYRDERNQIDVIKFDEDLNLWLADVATTWSALDKTGHGDRCQCCVSFKMMATSYDDLLTSLLEDEVQDRVSVPTIKEWGELINVESVATAIQTLQDIACALMNNEEHPDVSDATTDSSKVSSYSEDEDEYLDLADEDSDMSDLPLTIPNEMCQVQNSIEQTNTPVCDVQDEQVQLTTERSDSSLECQESPERVLQRSTAHGSKHKRRKEHRNYVQTFPCIISDQSSASNEISLYINVFDKLIHVPSSNNVMERVIVRKYAKTYLEMIIKLIQLKALRDKSSMKARRKDISRRYGTYSYNMKQIRNKCLNKRKNSQKKHQILLKKAQK